MNTSCAVCRLELHTNTLHVSYKHKTLKEQSWNLEYYVFGSISSTDIDVAINVPEIVFSLDPHYHTVLCDNLVPELKSIFQDKFNDTRPINPCLVHFNNGVIIKCQKGSVDETNNSIFHTFSFHLPIQMFTKCPILHTLKRFAPVKILGAIRMMTGILTNADLNIDETKTLTLNALLVNELKLLESNELQRYLSTILKGCDIKTSSWKIIHKTLKNMNDLEQKCKILRQRRNMVMSNLLKYIVSEDKEQLVTIFRQYWDVYLESTELTNTVYSEILDNSNLFDTIFLESFKADAIGSKLTLRCLAKSALRAQFVSFQVNLLENIDFRNLHIEGSTIDVEDKLKKIAFQVGQTLALIENDELYDKESISKKYPSLHNFLFRKQISNDDFIELNSLLKRLTSMVKSETIDEVKMCSKELKLKAL